MKHSLFAIAICYCASLVAAADTADLNNIIKVFTGPETTMQYQLAIHRESESKALACLVADEHLDEGIADQAVTDLAPLNLSLCPYGKSTNQYTRIKQAIRHNAKWTAVFVFAAGYECREKTLLYMRILNKIPCHEGPLLNSLYCKLSNTGDPTIIYEESGMAEEVFNSTGGLQPDEIGFEVDIEVFKNALIAKDICAIL